MMMKEFAQSTSALMFTALVIACFLKTFLFY